MNIQEGSVYLFQAEELEEDVMYGRQFSFMAISKELSAIDGDACVGIYPSRTQATN